MSLEFDDTNAFVNPDNPASDQIIHHHHNLQDHESTPTSASETTATNNPFTHTQSKLMKQEQRYQQQHQLQQRHHNAGPGLTTTDHLHHLNNSPSNHHNSKAKLLSDFFDILSPSKQYKELKRMTSPMNHNQHQRTPSHAFPSNLQSTQIAQPVHTQQHLEDPNNPRYHAMATALLSPPVGNNSSIRRHAFSPQHNQQQQHQQHKANHTHNMNNVVDPNPFPSTNISFEHNTFAYTDSSDDDSDDSLFDNLNNRSDALDSLDDISHNQPNNGKIQTQRPWRTYYQKPVRKIKKCVQRNKYFECNCLIRQLIHEFGWVVLKLYVMVVILCYIVLAFVLFITGAYQLLSVVLIAIPYVGPKLKENIDKNPSYIFFFTLYTVNFLFEPVRIALVIYWLRKYYTPQNGSGTNNNNNSFHDKTLNDTPSGLHHLSSSSRGDSGYYTKNNNTTTLGLSPSKHHANNNHMLKNNKTGGEQPPSTRTSAHKKNAKQPNVSFESDVDIDVDLNEYFPKNNSQNRQPTSQNPQHNERSKPQRYAAMQGDGYNAQSDLE